MSDFDNTWKRTHFCGDLREETSQKVILNGWVRGLREHSQKTVFRSMG